MEKTSLENFIAELKEETLPGVWSKGIQFSRSVKGIELLTPVVGAGRAGEMKFKIQTTERVVAYEVTLWPSENDSHCNCGSKIEPCHHIVAVALAYQNGQVQTTENRVGAKLVYTWFLSQNGQLFDLNLKREIVNESVRVPLTSSLSSLMGGVQSGRIQAPLPPTTQLDLKIDALLSATKIDWPALLPLLSELPPLALDSTGEKIIVPTPRPFSKPLLVVMDAPLGVRLALENEEASSGAHPLSPALHLKSGLVLENNELRIENSTAGKIKFDAFVPEERWEWFLNRELPRLRDEFEVRIDSRRLPYLVEGVPTLQFKVNRLREDEIAITPTLDYPAAKPGEMIRKNPLAEQELLKKLRQDHQLALHQTVHLDAKNAYDLLNRIDVPELKLALDGFLTDTLGELKTISRSTFEANRDTVLHLLELKQKGKLAGSALTLSKKFIPSAVAVKTSSTQPTALLKISRSLWDLLRDYQKEGVNWLAGHAQNQSGCILADDMGLGKTLQTICILQKPSLVVVPTSLLRNWQQEVARFRPEMKVNLYHGTTRAWDEDADITLTTYGVLRSETERFGREWKCAVLDEAHLIRNADTQAAVASFQISAKFKLALTGTPIQNRVRDLWSLFQFIAPGVFPSEGFLTRDLVSPFLLRRTKEEVLTELPPKTQLQHEVDFTPEERKIYQSVWASAKNEVVNRLSEGQKLSPLTIFEVLLRVRQNCDHVGLYDQSKWMQSSSKLDLLLELLEELLEAGHSVLVYSQWTKFLDRIQFSLKEKNLPWFRLDGSTQNRGQVVDDFQNSKESRVFLLSLHAGGVGLNLTRADHVIFCDPWWNPFVEIQAEDRAYRMGQEKPVTIHRLICKDSIEEKLLQLQAEKKKQGASFISEEAPAFTSLDFQNLLFRD